MSWKTDPPIEPAPRASGKRPWGLAIRLAVGYGLAAFALLLVASAYSYWALADTLTREDLSFLSEEVGEVEMLLSSKPDDAAVLRDHFDRETAAHLATPLFLRVVGPDGNPLSATPGMDHLLPSGLFPRPGPPGRPSNTRVTTNSGRPFELMAVSAHVDGKPMVVQGALDRTVEDRLLGRYRGHMAVVLLVGLVACAATGYAIARRGLYPLGNMAAVIERVSSLTLDQRVDGSAFPGELSSLAATFNAMLTRLEDAFARLSRFSADIAHELRTPIHNVRGMVEVTLAGGGSKNRTDDEQRKLLEPCLEECNRLSRLIDNLLFVARAENPETQIARQPVDVAEELAKVQEFYEAAAADAGVTLEIDRPVNGSTSGDTRAQLDRQLFQQAMCNLVENALAHTPAGGRIRLRARRENGAVRVEVSDTGAGIPPEHVPFVFDRFHRVDASRSKHTGGVGLGLALVKSIATLHGGSAAVQSTLGGGSTFAMTFPDAPATS